MSERDYSKTLEKVVEDVIASSQPQYGGWRPNSQLQTFEANWKLYKEFSDKLSVRKFFLARGNPYNPCVGIVTDSLIVDIYGSPSNYSGSDKGRVKFEALDSLTSVHLFRGQNNAFARSSNATLTVATDVGIHWSATNEDEEGYLLDFAEHLIERISSE